MQDDPNLNNNPNDNSSSNQPQAPISNPYREAAPFSNEAPKAPENYMELSEKEPQIAPEVEAAGVYKVSDKVKIDHEAKAAGMTEAKESNTFDINGQKVVLPMAPGEAKVNSKGSPSNSRSWLAKLVMVYLKRLGVKNA